MINEYDDIGRLLSDKEHPEVYHLTNDVHPGTTWWLKTVCPHFDFPDLDFFKIAVKWRELSDQYPDLVFVSDYAFDWDGEIIDKTSSVWLRVGVDAIIFDIENEAFVQLLPRLDGESLVISNLEMLFPEKERYTEFENQVRNGIENLKIYWEDQKGKQMRENFKVIK